MKVVEPVHHEEVLLLSPQHPVDQVLVVAPSIIGRCLLVEGLAELTEDVNEADLRETIDGLGGDIHLVLKGVTVIVDEAGTTTT